MSPNTKSSAKPLGDLPEHLSHQEMLIARKGSWQHWLAIASACSLFGAQKCGQTLHNFTSRQQHSSEV